MSERKFKFVSPGVEIREIDRSQVGVTPGARGPLVIGRTERGPAMRPTMIQTFNEFVQTFGAPIPGGRSGDIWRAGNYSSPTYASYAAQAYLRNNGKVCSFLTLGPHCIPYLEPWPLSSTLTMKIPVLNLTVYSLEHPP